jgi:phosphatidate cytidylyltransferase
MILNTLQDGIFQLYLALISGLMVFTGLLFLTLSKVFKKNLGAPLTIYRGWLIMVPLFFTFIILGRVALILGIFVLSALAFHEFSRAIQLNQNTWINRAVYFGIMAVAILALVWDTKMGHFGAYGLFMASPVYIIGLILLIPILQNQYMGQLQSIALGITGFIYFGWMLGHLSFLVNSDYSLNYVLYLVFAVEINDISAYTFGKFFGRHKLRPNISPNKTIEGAIGAFFVSMIMPWLFAFTFPEFGPLQLVLTGLIVGIGGQLGDLTISVIKRDVGIKDMGTLIPGHGGVLDRIDSLIFVTPLFFHMTRFFEALYK